MQLGAQPGVSGLVSGNEMQTQGTVGGAHRMVAKPRLQHEGAISLPVDFSTEGRAYHFKKLNANARLTLWITRPAATQRWEWFLAFVVAVVILRGIFAVSDRGGLRIAKAPHA